MTPGPRRAFRAQVEALALERIHNERCRQNGKWGDQEHTLVEWVSIALEELGEAAEHANKLTVEPIAPGACAVPEAELLRFLTELIETAAVCVAAYEDIFERYPQLSRAVTVSRSESSP